jgi:hypothetical protein
MDVREVGRGIAWTEVARNIATCISVNIDGVWNGNWIYWTLTTRNYKCMDLHGLQFTTAHP